MPAARPRNYTPPTPGASLEQRRQQRRVFSSRKPRKLDSCARDLCVPAAACYPAATARCVVLLSAACSVVYCHQLSPPKKTLRVNHPFSLLSGHRRPSWGRGQGAREEVVRLLIVPVLRCGGRDSSFDFWPSTAVVAAVSASARCPDWTTPSEHYIIGSVG